jgi:guanylate kinase
MEEFIFREQLKVMQKDENKRRHLVFSGPSGIGKTKILDQALLTALQEAFKYEIFICLYVMSCVSKQI